MNMDVGKQRGRPPVTPWSSRDAGVFHHACSVILHTARTHTQSLLYCRCYTVMTLSMASAWVAFAVSAISIIASTTTASSLDWPYSVLLANLTSQVERCSKVSGFQFLNNSSPNARQLASMCADPDCIAVTNNLFKRDKRDEATYSAAFAAFTLPVVDYCWYMREPGTPCPADKWATFLSYVTDKDANCARGTGYSFMDPTMKNWTLPDKSPCPSDCWPLGIRLFYLEQFMPCPLANRTQLYLDIGTALYAVAYCHLYWADDQGPKPSENFPFAYTPGWPLPPTPATPSPVDTRPPGSNASSSGSSGAEMTPPAGIPGEEEPTPSSDGANGLSTPPFRQPTPSAAIPLTPPPAHREETQQNEEMVSSAPVATKKARETATSQAEEELKTRPPSVTTAPEVTTSTKTSDRSLLPVIGSSGIGLALLAAIFIVAQRRNEGSNSKDGDDDFTTMNSPSTGTNLRTTDNWSSDRARTGLAMITKAIPVKHIQDIRIIGSGGYGVVFLVRDTLNDRLLASKRLVDASQASNDKIDGFIREIQLVSTLQHPSIVTFIGATWTNSTDVQALFEYMDGGDLRTYLDNTPVPVAATIQATQHTWTIEKLSIAIDIADALDYVHSTRDRDTPLVHRDLKSRNVLLSKSPRRAKLSDFGVSRELSNNMSMTDGVGTSRWLAPEVILGGGDYGTTCDVYSFGVVLSELDTHKLPFWDCGGSGGGTDGLDSVVPEIAILRMVAMEGVQPSFSGSCPPKLLELACQCLSHNPAERPTAAVIVRTLRELRSDN